ncbi:MAG: hypothetical protein A07HR60_00019 [uncultured archaeon A07HR60]|nr:MAG: hypothetical protein A07HR60_00019 [uncultured archaeon A07HR60]
MQPEIARNARGELPRPARADALAEGGASCFHDALCRDRCLHSERSLHRRFFGVSHSYSSVLDGTGPSGSARFLSRSNATRVRRLHTERVVPNGTTSESKPTGRNARLDQLFDVQWDKSVVCARGSGTERAKQMMTALYPHPALLARLRLAP